MGGLESLADLVTLSSLQSEVNSAGEALKNSPSAQTNKAYKEALQKMLNHRAYMIQNAHAKHIVPGNMEEDWALSADSLLSVGELKLINQSIKPINGDTRSNPRGLVTKFRRTSINRKPLRTWDGVLQTADSIDVESQKNPIVGLPSNWGYNTIRGMLENRLALRKTGSTWSDRIPSPELQEMLAISFAAAEVDEFLNPGTVILRESNADFVGSVIINGINGKRASTDEETVAIIASLDKAGSAMKLPGTTGTGTSGINVFVTNWGKEWKAKGYTENGVLAYANDAYGVTILADRVRQSKYERDNGLRENDMHGGKDSWFSTAIRKGTMDLWDHTTAHEIGHMIAFKLGLSEAQQGRDVAPSKYGKHSAWENFAEYYARYIRTSQAPPWFIDLLQSRGLLKSQQN